MNMQGMENPARRGAVPLAGLLFAWLLAAGCGAWLLAGGSSVAPSGAPERSVLWQILGASRKGFSQQCLAEAERYFHRGVSHSGRKVFHGLYASWAEAISPVDHIEAAGTELHEILPLLRLSVQLDPQNVESYLTAAYWLDRSGELELAAQVIREAESFNPGDYRIKLHQSRLFLRQGDREAAARELDGALTAWPSGQDSEELQARLELAQVLCLRASLYEAGQDREEALRLYQRALDLFPDRDPLRRRVHSLERGEDTSAWAAGTLEALFSHPAASHLQPGAHDDHSGHAGDPDAACCPHDPHH